MSSGNGGGHREGPSSTVDDKFILKTKIVKKKRARFEENTFGDIDTDAQDPEESSNEGNEISKTTVIPLNDNGDDGIPVLLRNRENRIADPDFSASQFENVRIEDFGAALLRGMGWSSQTESKKTVSIEHNSSEKKRLLPVVVEARPSLLGLGAMPKPTNISNKSNGSQQQSSLAQRPPSRWLYQDAIVKIHAGRYQGEIAVVKTADGVPGLNNMIVYLDPGSDATTLTCLPEVIVKRDQVKLIESQQTLDPYHPGCKLLAKVQKDRQSEVNDQTQANSGSKRKRTLEDRQYLEQDASTQAVSSVSATTSSSVLPKNHHQEECWLMPGIRVRVVSRLLGNGKYYSQKGVVLDVLDPMKCTCILSVGEVGAILEGVAQRQLDTALPKKGGRVLVVRGDHKGATGTLLDRDSSRSKATVQMNSDLNVKRFHFDFVAEYVKLQNDEDSEED